MYEYPIHPLTCAVRSKIPAEILGLLRGLWSLRGNLLQGGQTFNKKGGVEGTLVIGPCMATIVYVCVGGRVGYPSNI